METLSIIPVKDKYEIFDLYCVNADRIGWVEKKIFWNFGWSGKGLLNINNTISWILFKQIIAWLVDQSSLFSITSDLHVQQTLSAIAVSNTTISDKR